MSSCYSFKVRAVWGLLCRGHLNFYDVVLHWIFRLPRPVVFVNCFFIVCVYCNSFTDDRFVMKQMSKQELQCFLEFAPHYFRYVNKALDEQVCVHVTGCHYKCQAHTWNTYPLTPQPIRFNLQPFAPKVSLRRKEKSSSLLSNFLEVMGSFLEKRHGLIPNLMEMLLKNLFANIWTLPFNFFIRTRREGMNRIKYEGSQHQRRGCVQWGIQGRGPGGLPPPYFLTTLRPEGLKKFFFLRPGPPLFISGSGWPGYPVIWRCGSPKDGDLYKGGSRGGARGVVPPYFLTRVRPEGRKKFLFLRPGPSLFTSGSEWPGCPVIWRCGSATGVGVIKPLSKRSSWDVLVPKSVMFRVCKTKPFSPA